MKNYIPSLNGFRAISVIMVFAFHAALRYIGPEPWLDYVPFLFSGELGVSVFFVISGFLITTLLLQEEQETGTVSLKDFYIRRAFRIFPLYFTLLAFYGILQLTGYMHFEPISWFSSLTFTKYIFPKGADFATAHLWSIAIEEHFYILWPSIFFFFPKHRIKIAFAAVLLAPLVRLIGTSYRVDVNFSIWPLLMRGDTLMWGCIFAIYNKQISAWIAKAWNMNKLFIVVPIVLMYIGDRNIVERIIYHPSVMEIDQKYHLRLYIIRIINTCIGKSYSTMIAVSIATLMLFSINHRNTLWFKFLNTRPMNYIGKLSYSIYIWQQINLTHAFTISNNIVKSIVFTAGMAVSSFYLIEKPFLRLKDRFHAYKANSKHEIVKPK